MDADFFRTDRVRMSAAKAVVRYQTSITFPSGKRVEVWHTDTYELKEATWVAVWSQATELPEPPATESGLARAPTFAHIEEPP